MSIARPSFQPDGLVLVVNPGYQDHFEVLETTPPLVSIKLNNPDMKAHTQVYRWYLSTGSTKDVPLIVSCKLFYFLILAHSRKKVLHVRPYERHQMKIIFRVTGPWWGNSTGNSPHKGQWCVALVFYLICVWTHGWANCRDASDLRRYDAGYIVIIMWVLPLQWRHNERDDVSNHQSHDCLHNRLFKRRSKKTSTLRVTDPLWGEFTGDRWIPRTQGQ